MSIINTTFTSTQALFTQAAQYGKRHGSMTVKPVCLWANELVLGCT